MGELQTHHFYDFGISGRVHGSKNQLCLFMFIFGDPRIPKIIQIKSRAMFAEYFYKF